VREKTRNAYKRFKQDSQQRGLHFKKLFTSSKGEEIYSVRIDRYYRAVGEMKGNEVVWDWVGGHPDYEEHLKKLM
jgi:hypothetical protein